MKNIIEKRLLWEEFRRAFVDLDRYSRGNDYHFRKEAAEVSHVTLMLTAFRKKYIDILDEEEKNIISERIEMGIHRLIMLDQSHILCLYYFGKNYEKNPGAMIHRAQVFISAIRALFEIAPKDIPLESTVWNYFVRDIQIFTNILVRVISTAEEPEKGELLFLLASLIHSLLSAKRSLEKIETTTKRSELLGKTKSSLKIAVSCLLDQADKGALKYYLDNSPGLVIYLRRVLHEDLSEYDGDALKTLEQVVVKKFSEIDFKLINEKTKSLAIFNMAETNENVPKEIQVSSNSSALSFLANGYVRFENGDDFLGILPVTEGTFEEIHVDDIDSFQKTTGVKSTEIAGLVPLKLPEDFIKKAFAEIIGEQFVQDDWGGERADLFTSRLELKKSRIDTAFMFKGRGLRTRLTLAHCGANGDQILRMFKLPAQLFVVQHVNEIDPAVHEFTEMIAETTARQRGKKVYYCLIDGVDTGRVLKAYGKIDNNGTIIEKPVS